MYVCMKIFKYVYSRYHLYVCTLYYEIDSMYFPPSLGQDATGELT